MKRLLLLHAFSAFFAVKSTAAPKLTDHTAAAAIIGEAGNQSDRCMLAVAGAIRLRAQGSRTPSLQGIYGVNNPVVKHAGPNLWARAARAWRASAANPALASAGCRYFGNPADAPYFRQTLHYHPVLTLGTITFYKP
jgi:hypothetical protein